MNSVNEAPQRLHALDAVRAFALLSGIVLHAAMSFLPFFGYLGWIIIDDSPSLTLTLLFYFIHQFRMLLFFLIAGFFSHLMFHRRGLRSFVLDRLRRITVPMIVGWVVLMPMIVVTVVIAAIQRPDSTPVNPMEERPQFLPFPLTHLWFLYVLQWLYLIVLLIRGAFAGGFDRSGKMRSAIDRAVAVLLRGPWSVPLLAIPLCAALCTYSDWIMWLGIPTPDMSLIPNLPAFVAFFSAFSLGWIIHRQPDLLRIWERNWLLYALLGTALTIVCLSIIGPVATIRIASTSVSTVAYAACYAMSAWCWTFAMIGIGLKFFSEPNKYLRYLADSSYWLYLIHLPVVFLAQALVMKWNVNWMVKFPLILLVTIPLMLLSYHLLVRWTYIGWMLNGRMYPIFGTAPIEEPKREPLAHLASTAKEPIVGS